MRRTQLRRKRPFFNFVRILPDKCRKCGVSSQIVIFTQDPKKLTCDNCIYIIRAHRPVRVREETTRSSSHLAFVRTLPCAVLRPECFGIKHAHHVRSASTAGTGLKPSDFDTVCLCARHHDELHLIGTKTFQSKYKIDLAHLAAMTAKASAKI